MPPWRGLQPIAVYPCAKRARKRATCGTLLIPRLSILSRRGASHCGHTSQLRTPAPIIDQGLQVFRSVGAVETIESLRAMGAAPIRHYAGRKTVHPKAVQQQFNADPECIPMMTQSGKADAMRAPRAAHCVSAARCVFRGGSWTQPVASAARWREESWSCSSLGCSGTRSRPGQRSRAHCMALVRVLRSMPVGALRVRFRHLDIRLERMERRLSPR
jgi:hypothetical protein